MRFAALLILLVQAAAPVNSAQQPKNGEPIQGKYIVSVKSAEGSVVGAIDNLIRGLLAEPDYVFLTGFQGFAGNLTDEELQSLSDEPTVNYIEQDAVICISGTTVETQADWGLARISSQEPYTTTYDYDSSAGSGTCAYILDTGIDITNPDFGGRASFAANYVDNEDTDGNGHGTHVSGTVAGKTYGVAKKATLFAVKVLDSSGQGSNSVAIKGMEYAIENSRSRDCPNGVVVNMSLGGSYSQSVNSAADSVVSAGLFLAVAAGNDAADASNTSPASAKSACTVGATNLDDSFASYSNYGSVVDVLAPGTNITSDWPGDYIYTMTGTSMATPHVTGLGAYFLGLGHKADGLCDYISSMALQGKISNLTSGTNNLLIHNDMNRQ